MKKKKKKSLNSDGQQLQQYQQNEQSPLILTHWTCTRSRSKYVCIAVKCIACTC